MSPRSVTNIDMAKKKSKSKEPEKGNPGRPRTLPKELDTRMQIRCAKADEDAWKAHAIDLGFPNASAWIRKTLNDAMKAQQAE